MRTVPTIEVTINVCLEQYASLIVCSIVSSDVQMSTCIKHLTGTPIFVILSYSVRNYTLQVSDFENINVIRLPIRGPQVYRKNVKPLLWSTIFVY